MVWWLQGGNGGYVLQVLPKMVNIKLGKKSEALLRKMLRKSSLYRSVHLITNEAVGSFYASERKRGFR